jgi:GNAT superfamily N-acetyltransferase
MPAAPHVRDAAPGDAPAIAALLAELGYPAGPEEAGGHVVRLARDGASRVQVAELGGRVVGLVATHLVPRLDGDRWTCRVTDLVVAADHRRAGIGGALLAAAEAEARARGAPRLDLSSGDWRADAHAFYAAHGFTSRARSWTKRLSGPPPPGPAVHHALAAELLRMAAEDRRIRTPPDGDDAFVRLLTVEERIEHARVDIGHADRLREIVAEHGWPGVSLVGEEGADAAWLIAQHADRQLDLQRELLPLLAHAARIGEAKPSHLAYLTDRVRMNEGRPQVYGTQIADAAGTPWPIEDPDGVDERRRALGLGPLADAA